MIAVAITQLRMLTQSQLVRDCTSLLRQPQERVVQCIPHMEQVIMAQVQLGTDQGIQLTLSSALPPNAEAPRSPSALRHDAEARINRLLDFLTKRSAVGSGSVSTYKASKSTGSENQYFRYTYRVAGKQKSKSIPGGNIRSRLAQHRAQMVKEAIIAGKSSHEIVYLIGSFKHSK